MKKQILNIGKTLTKTEQKLIEGGDTNVLCKFCRGFGETGQICQQHSDCDGYGSGDGFTEPVCFRGCCNTYV